MARKTHKKPTYKNFDSMPSKWIITILDSHNCTGQDGQDYGPYKEELEAVLWSRQEKAQAIAMADYERDQKAYTKHLAIEAKKARNNK